MRKLKILSITTLLMILIVNVFIRFGSGNETQVDALRFTIRSISLFLGCTGVFCITRKFELEKYLNEENLLSLLLVYLVCLLLLMHSSWKYTLSIHFMFVLYTASLLKLSFQYVRKQKMTLYSMVVTILNVMIFAMYLMDDFGMDPSRLFLFTLFGCIAYFNSKNDKEEMHLVRLVAIVLLVTCVNILLVYGTDYFVFKLKSVFHPEIGTEFAVIKAVMKNVPLVGASNYQTKTLLEYLVRHIPMYVIAYQYGKLAFIGYLGLVMVFVASTLFLIRLDVRKNQTFALTDVLLTHLLYVVVLSTLSFCGSYPMLGTQLVLSFSLLIHLFLTKKRGDDIMNV